MFLPKNLQLPLILTPLARRDLGPFKSQAPHFVMLSIEAQVGPGFTKSKEVTMLSLTAFQSAVAKPAKDRQKPKCQSPSDVIVTQ